MSLQDRRMATRLRSGVLLLSLFGMLLFLCSLLAVRVLAGAFEETGRRIVARQLMAEVQAWASDKNVQADALPGGVSSAARAQLATVYQTYPDSAEAKLWLLAFQQCVHDCMKQLTAFSTAPDIASLLRSEHGLHISDFLDAFRRRYDEILASLLDNLRHFCLFNAGLFAIMFFRSLRSRVRAATSASIAIFVLKADALFGLVANGYPRFAYFGVLARWMVLAGRTVFGSPRAAA